MSISLSVFIATIVNFLMLVVILKKILFKPVNNVIENRSKEITDTIEKTEADKKKAEEYKLQSESLVKTSKLEGKNIVENYKEKAEKVSKEIINDAHEEANRIMERAKKEIEREREKAADEIKTETINLAIELSKKALEESIDEVKHRQIIEDFIAKVGN